MRIHKNSWFLSFVLAVALAAQMSSCKSPEQKAKDQQAAAILKKTSFGDNSANLEGKVEMLVRRSRADLTDKQVQDIRSHLMKVVSEDAVRKKMQGELTKELDLNSLTQINSWYDTPLAKKVMDADRVLLSDKAQEELMNFQAEMKKNPPSANRLKLISDLDKTTGMTERTMQMMAESMQRASKQVMGKLGKATGADQKTTEKSKEDIAKSLNSLPPQMLEMIKESMKTSLLYKFHNFSDQELTSYIAFLSTPAATKYTHLTQDFMSKLNGELMDALDQELAKAMPASPAK